MAKVVGLRFLLYYSKIKYNIHDFMSSSNNTIPSIIKKFEIEQRKHLPCLDGKDDRKYTNKLMFDVFRHVTLMYRYNLIQSHHSKQDKILMFCFTEFQDPHSTVEGFEKLKSMYLDEDG